MRCIKIMLSVYTLQIKLGFADSVFGDSVCLTVDCFLVQIGGIQIINSWLGAVVLHFYTFSDSVKHSGILLL